MTTKVKLKEVFEVESTFKAFFTGGNIEWLSENIILCQKESTLQFLDTTSGKVTCTLGENDNDENTDIINTFTSNNTAIITAHKSGLLKLWNHEGIQEKVWKSIHKGPVSKMCIDVNNRLATGGSDGIVRIWDIKYHACTHSLKGCQGVISSLIFHPLKNCLFASGDDCKIHSWDLNTSDPIKEYNGHFSKVTSMVFSLDFEYLISSSRDKVIILWDINKGVSLKTIPLFESIESVEILPKKFTTCGIKCSKSIFVAAAGENGVIRIWDVLKNKEMFVQKNSLIPKAKEEGGLSIIKLIFNPKLLQFCVVSAEHNILFYDLENFECFKQFVGFSDEILDLCFVGKNDSYLAVATNSADIKLYDCNTMNCNLIQGHSEILLALVKCPTNPNLFLSSAKDNSIRLWLLTDPNEADVKFKVSCVGIGSKHAGSVSSIAFSQTKQNFVVSVSQDTTIKFWQIPNTLQDNQTLECIRTEIAHQKDINCVTVSPNDKIIATGSQDKLCKLWNENLEILGTLRGHKRGIWCVKFSPVDQIVITSSADCTIKLWSISELNCLKTFEGHDSSVLKIEFLSNGMQILSSGADGLLKVFSVKTSECNMTLDKHDGRVWALAVKSDESTIFSGGSDSMLVKWKDVTLEKRLEKAKQLEELTLQEQQLSNLIHNNELLKALQLALRLDRPYQTLKIIQGIIKKGDSGLANTISELTDNQKESLLKCTTTWNMNSKHCQSAQIVLNILLNELQTGKFRPIGLSHIIESTLPYTERHFKRLTQLLQDLQFINYTVNCMQPFAKKSE